MASEVSLCNQALGALGTRSTIASLTENSREALQCRTNFENVRDMVLQDFQWDFANKFATAALLKAAPGTTENPSGSQYPWDPTTTPPPPWLYEYTKPSDCLKLWFVMPQPASVSGVSIPLFGTATMYAPEPVGQASKFKMAVDQDANGNDIAVILTNVQRAILSYGKRITNVDLWSPTFQRAFVLGLAHQICNSLTSSKELKGQLFQEYLGVLDKAKMDSANETVDVYNPSTDWLDARDSDSPYGTESASWLLR